MIFSIKLFVRRQYRFPLNKCVVFHVSLTLENKCLFRELYLRHAISTLGNSRHITLFTIWMIFVCHFAERLVCVRTVSGILVTPYLCLALKFPPVRKGVLTQFIFENVYVQPDTDRKLYATILDAYHRASRWKTTTHTLSRLKYYVVLIGDRGLLYVTSRVSRKLNKRISTYVGSLVVQATLETLRIFTLLFDLKGIGFRCAILTRRPLFVC